MFDATIELAKYKIEQNRTAYKLYLELIDMMKGTIMEFRGTEVARICYINIATLTDMLDDLTREVKEYEIEASGEEIEEPKEENIRVLNGDLYEGGTI